MIEVKVERRRSGKTMWCQSCGAHESKTLSFLLDGSEAYGSSVHLCNDCLKELADKINATLEGENNDSE